MPVAMIMKSASFAKDSRFGPATAAITAVLLLLTPASDKAQGS